MNISDDQLSTMLSIISGNKKGSLKKAAETVGIPVLKAKRILAPYRNPVRNKPKVKKECNGIFDVNEIHPGTSWVV